MSTKLERLLARKVTIENAIEAELAVLFPAGSECSYRTYGMKRDRCGKVSHAGLYGGHPSVCVQPDHSSGLRRMPARFVTVL